MDPVPIASHVISADSIEGNGLTQWVLAMKWTHLSCRLTPTLGGVVPHFSAGFGESVGEMVTGNCPGS